jgi:hypothetical protein
MDNDQTKAVKKVREEKKKRRKKKKKKKKKKKRDRERVESNRMGRDQ